MYKYSTCTEMFARTMNLEQTLEILEELRFEHLDMAWKFLGQYVAGEKPFRELKDILSKFKVKPAAIMGTLDFGISDRKTAELTRSLEGHIGAAKQLEVDIIRVFVSLIPEQYIDDHAIQHAVNNIKKASSAVERGGVKLALENHFGITSTAEDVIRILEDVNSPSVGVNFDPANFVVSKEDPVSAGRKLAPYVIYTHLKDCIHTGTGRWFGYEFVEAGAGLIDYRTLLSNLKEDGYRGILSLEYEKPDDVVRGTIVSRRNLEKILSSL